MISTGTSRCSSRIAPNARVSPGCAPYEEALFMTLAFE
jgi:hypothetical protein